jgi:hypothetical protein
MFRIVAPVVAHIVAHIVVVLNNPQLAPRSPYATGATICATIG